jgi:hypothetical protein
MSNIATLSSIKLEFGKKQKTLKARTASGKLRQEIDKIAPLRESAFARVAVAMIKDKKMLDRVQGLDAQFVDFLHNALTNNDLTTDEAAAMISSSASEMTPERYYACARAICDTSSLTDEELVQFASEEFWLDQDWVSVREFVDNFRRIIA